MVILAQALATGLVFGALYALLSSGVALQAGVMKIINITHGHVMALAMYLTWELHRRLGVDPYASLLVTVPVSFLLGCVIYILFLHTARRRDPLNLVIITLGLTAMLESALLIAYSADLHTLRVAYLDRTIVLGPVFVSLVQVLAFALSLAGVALMYGFLHLTYFGRAIRAAAENEYAARLMGVDTSRVRVISFGLASATAGLTGTLLMPMFHVTPVVGWEFLLWAFVAVVIGGLGSMTGALVGGLFVGLAQSVTGGFFTGHASSMLLFGLMVAVLLWRPEGLLGERTVR
jgi:branched-chain amino acid transport system permease protein